MSWSVFVSAAFVGSMSDSEDELEARLRAFWAADEEMRRAERIPNPDPLRTIGEQEVLLDWYAQADEVARRLRHLGIRKRKHLREAKNMADDGVLIETRADTYGARITWQQWDEMKRLMTSCEPPAWLTIDDVWYHDRAERFILYLGLLEKAAKCDNEMACLLGRKELVLNMQHLSANADWGDKLQARRIQEERQALWTRMFGGQSWYEQ